MSHRHVAQPLTHSQIGALIDTRAKRPEIREERVGYAPALAAAFVNPLSAWRGRSGRRYLVSAYKLEAAEPADLLNAVVIFVGRDLDGVASIVGRARDLTEHCAETLLETAHWSGCVEVHVHRLAEPHERGAVLLDLSHRASEAL